MSLAFGVDKRNQNRVCALLLEAEFFYFWAIQSQPNGILSFSSQIVGKTLRFVVEDNFILRNSGSFARISREFRQQAAAYRSRHSAVDKRQTKSRNFFQGLL